MRGATSLMTTRWAWMTFQSTPLMRGATDAANTRQVHLKLFQSTPLMRGATHGPHGYCPTGSHFNPRPSCEGRLSDCAQIFWLVEFQSTPLMRGATNRTNQLAMDTVFQSTPLMRGATKGVVQNVGTDTISIHAPHARGDTYFRADHMTTIISIHAPHARGDRYIMYCNDCQGSIEALGAKLQ